MGCSSLSDLEIVIASEAKQSSLRQIS